MGRGIAQFSREGELLVFLGGGDRLDVCEAMVGQPGEYLFGQDLGHRGAGGDTDRRGGLQPDFVDLVSTVDQMGCAGATLERDLDQTYGVGRIPGPDHDDEVGLGRQLSHRLLAVLGGITDVVARRREQGREAPPEDADGLHGLADAQGGLGQPHHLRRVTYLHAGRGRRSVDELDAVGRLAQGADDLFVALVADQKDVVVLVCEPDSCRTVTWALDMTGGELALLINHGQELVYIPGVAVNRGSDSYRGQGKTDARDARAIADQARMGRDLQPIRPDDVTVELRLLTDRHVGLVAERTRAINRLRSLLTGMFPVLERALDLGTSGAVVLLTGYQAPVAIRHTGQRRTTWLLRTCKVRGAEALATKAVKAAERQHTAAVAGETAIAKMVLTFTKEMTALNEKNSETDKPIEGRFREHELAEMIQSLPGIGTVLGAEFLVAVGRSLDAFPSPDRLAAFAGGDQPHHATRARSAAISTALGATTGTFNGSSTPRRW